MKILRPTLFLVAFVVVGAIAVVVTPPFLLKYSAISRAEKDFRKIVSDGATEVFVGYPELVDRIVKDEDLSRSITKVHLVGPNGANSNFDSLRFLPHLTEVEVTYGHGVDKIVPTLNSIVGLTTARFYYCGQLELVLNHIDNQKLSRIVIHMYQPSNDADRLTKAMLERLPNCSVEITND
jgi:hypothetical protein